MAHWSLDIDKWCGKSKAKLDDVKRTFAFMLYSAVVKKTPVDTGRARGNWNVSVGSPDYSVSDTKTKTPKIQSPEQMPKAPGDAAIYIANNLPYIKTLEFGGYPSPVEKGTWVKKGKSGPGHYEIRSEGGFSKQAPQGMVGITVAKAPYYLKKALDNVQG